MSQIFRGLLLLAAAAFCFNAHAEAAIKFNDLPFDLALKIVKGGGQRKLAYFTDPQCNYCKKLEEELTDIDNVTLYVFLYPVFPGSEGMVRDVMCASDPAKTWDDLMLRDRRPPPRYCATQAGETLHLGKRLHVEGTPTLIFQDGSMVSGYLPSASLELMLFASGQ